MGFCSNPADILYVYFVTNILYVYLIFPLCIWATKNPFKWTCTIWASYSLMSCLYSAKFWVRLVLHIRKYFFFSQNENYLAFQKTTLLFILNQCCRLLHLNLSLEISFCLVNPMVKQQALHLCSSVTFNKCPVWYSDSISVF